MMKHTHPTSRSAVKPTPQRAQVHSDGLTLQQHIDCLLSGLVGGLGIKECKDALYD